MAEITRASAETALTAELSMDLFISMATNGSLMYSDLRSAERPAFDMFIELGWVEYSGGAGRYYLTEAGVEVIDRAQEAGRAALLSSLVATAVGEG